ncbi:MAG: hypothetical protein AAF497_19535, partial [Planctomycetota bacterium]
MHCSCQKSFRARSELAGKRVACPACKQPILVPEPPGERKLKPLRAEDAAGLLDESFEALPPSRESRRQAAAEANYYKTIAIVAASVVLTSVLLIEVVQWVMGVGKSEVAVATGDAESPNADSSSLGEEVRNQTISPKKDASSKNDKAALLEKAYAALPVSVDDYRRRYKMFGEPSTNRIWTSACGSLFSEEFNAVQRSLPLYPERVDAVALRETRAVLRANRPVYSKLQNAISHKGKFEFDVAHQKGNVLLQQAQMLGTRYLQMAAMA